MWTVTNKCLMRLVVVAGVLTILLLPNLTSYRNIQSVNRYRIDNSKQPDVGLLSENNLQLAHFTNFTLSFETVSSWIDVQQSSGGKNFVLILDWFLSSTLTYNVVRTTASDNTGKDLTCFFTNDRRFTAKANSVVIFLGNRLDLPANKPTNQKWIVHQVEAPANSVRPVPSWLTANISLFDLHASYSKRSHLYDPYGKCWSIEGTPSSPDVSNKILGVSSDVEAAINSKTRLVAWIVSHCAVQSARELYVKQLQRYLKIDIFGDCAIKCQRRNNVCFSFISKTYKFVLAFENSFCTDYVSEKAWRFLTPQLFAVPVVLGMANYSEVLPSGSFIDASKFNSPQALTNYLQYLDGNQTEYMQFYRWRKKFQCDDKGHYLDSFCSQAHAHTSSKYSLSSEEFQNIIQPKRDCITPRQFYSKLLDNKTLSSWPNHVLDRFNLYNAN